MARECKITKNGGDLTLLLTVTNGIISGGDFSIYEFDTGEVIENFKMHVDTSGTDEQIIKTSAKKLVGKVLSWHILSCSPIITDTCRVTLEVFQNNKKCPMNKPAQYDLKKVPSCSLNVALPLKGGLHFVTTLAPQV